MTIRRAALYVVGGTLLLAYLAAADNSPARHSGQPRDDSARRTAQAQPDALAADVRAQAVKLRDRLATAPAPDAHGRNPFGFGAPSEPHAVGAPRGVRAATIENAPAPVPPDPPLTLMGVAEDAPAGKVQRTAIIGGTGDELYMVTEGDSVAGRYQVTAIGADIVELKDLQTGGYRRLAMR
jgi:hypothetical protein